MHPEAQAERDRIGRSFLRLRDEVTDPVWRHFLKLCVTQIVYGKDRTDMNTDDIHLDLGGGEGHSPACGGEEAP